MTTHKIRRIEPDGTRVYHDYHRYTPLAAEARTNRVRKPDDPRAVRFHGAWFLPLVTLDEPSRVMPETRPDTDAYHHIDKAKRCKCAPCKRPTAERWRAAARSGSSSPPGP